jgi:Cu(I)/Ag(I) efflux system membrane fusion protein
MKLTKIILLAAIAGLLWLAGANDAENSALTEPVKYIFNRYLKIRAALAKDSLAGVAESANAIKEAVRGDAKTLPAEVGTQAEALAKASDLNSARAAFKPLSDALIQYFADHKAKGTYVEVYCPMARASWLQADRNVNNPYFGPAMSGCGQIQD